MSSKNLFVTSAASIFLTTIVAVSPVGAQTAAKAPAKPAAKSVAAAPSSVPRLVDGTFEKCKMCRTKARKRVAVMPVKIGTLSAELGMAEEVVAAKVRDRVEASVAAADNLITLNRSDLEGVLGEQALATSGVANRELAPAPGKVIPAQLLLYVTVDRLDFETRTERLSSSSAEAFYKQAQDKEEAAMKADNETRNYETQATSLANMSAPPTYVNPQGNQAVADIFARGAQAQESIRSTFVQDAQRKAASARDRAAKLRSEAEMLRQRAKLEAQNDVSEKKTTTARIRLVWRAIDTSSGHVLASGDAGAQDVAVATGTSTETAFRQSAATDSARSDVLVNGVLAEGVSDLASQVEQKLSTEPFRAKIAATDARGLLINAGSDLGVGVGDTFGVRQKAAGLTDPDTGLPLDDPGDAVGVIRVVEVQPKSSKAVLVKSAGPIKRGDELEWIGIYLTPEELAAQR